MRYLRQVTSLLLMVTGLAMLTKGLYRSYELNLGWQGFLQTAVIGALIFALGFARWRFWRQK